ncbi:DMT family transporter [Psychromicrobium lacuslunae]|uniref:Cation transporter n=1 Tax=Psychromicrobium lacuslunae TaxID=1618207 RepID=A0A0D4C1E5_9MICC|nr:multidrug efflux SMR transporter [Psychromicrobium lacuslunae]AJT42220.1 cation transporter [Psychromicrobium lacuslunae]
MLAWLFLTGAIVLEVAATLSLRASDGLSRWPWLIPTGIGYLGAFGLLAQVLKMGLPVGVAYGVWAAAGVALTALLGWLIFKEPLTWPMLIGILLVIAGVLLIETGQQSNSH